MLFQPFFINSNIITNKSSLISYDSFLTAIAGNTGNSYITYALLKELGISELKDEFHIQNIYEFDFSKIDETADFVNANCTHVFLILQDQIRIAESYGLLLPYENIKKLLEKIKVPVVIAGLGANCFTGFDKEFYKQLNPNLVDFLHYLSNRCSEFGVRGNFTAEVLNQLSIKNVVPVGCPSFFETGKSRKILKKEFITEDKVLFTQHICTPNVEINYQICQDEQEKNIIREFFKTQNSVFESNLDWFQLRKFIQKKYRIFSSIDDWKNFVRQFDFSIGYRLHGCILSLNSGLVSVCCNGDSRAREMCELLKIPYMPTLDPNTDMVKLYNQIDVSDLNNSYNGLYDNFSSFIERNCGVKIFSEKEKHVGLKQPTLKLYENHTENSLLLIHNYNLRKTQELESKCNQVLEEANARINEQSARLEEANAKINEQSARLEETNSRINEQSARLEEANSRINEQSARLEEANARINEQSARLEEAKFEIENHKDEIIFLTNKLNECVFELQKYTPLFNNYNRLKRTFLFKILRKIFYFLKKVKNILK